MGKRVPTLVRRMRRLGKFKPIARTTRNWEDQIVIQDNIADVMEGLNPLRRSIPAKERIAMNRILDGGNMGRSEDLSFEGTGPEGRSILEVVGDDREATTLSITLIAQLPPFLQADLLAPIDGKAIVQWGNSGVQADAELDFINGTTFSINCSFLRINAVPNEQASALRNTQFTRYGAFVSYLPLSGAIPTRTLDGRFDARSGSLPLAPGFSMDFTIPRFAKRLYVYRVNSAPTSGLEPGIQVRFLDQALTSVGAERIADGERWADFIPVPNSGRFIRVLNISAGVFTIGQLFPVFQLSI